MLSWPEFIRMPELLNSLISATLITQGEEEVGWRSTMTWQPGTTTHEPDIAVHEPVLLHTTDGTPLTPAL